MSKLLRYYSEGNIYFTTSVTYDRQLLLKECYPELKSCLDLIQDEIDIKIISWVLLPDHFHLIIEPHNENLSKIMKIIKLKYSYLYKKKYKLYEKTIWQKRFWDHIIRDEADLNNQMDNIHYNPVKHGYVKRPFDWEYSSIHDYKRNGYYQSDWGVKEELNIDGEFGE